MYLRCVTENGPLAKNNIDVRLYNLKGPVRLWGGGSIFASWQDPKRAHQFRQRMSNNTSAAEEALDCLVGAGQPFIPVVHVSLHSA
jgi:hypothetical protein